MNDRELLEQALEALDMFANCDAFIPNLKKLSQDDEDHEEVRRDAVYRMTERAITALRERLERQETHSEECWRWHHECAVAKIERLARQEDSQRQWVGLTDDEIKEIIGPWGPTPINGYTRKLFDQIEAKLKEKNT